MVDYVMFLYFIHFEEYSLNSGNSELHFLKFKFFVQLLISLNTARVKSKIIGEKICKPR